MMHGRNYLRRTGCLTALLLAYSMVSACSMADLTAPEEEAAIDLMPLVVGNRWEYRCLRVDPETGDTLNEPNRQITLTGWIEIDAFSYGLLSDGRVALTTPDGLVLADYDTVSRMLSDNLFLKYPVYTADYDLTTIAGEKCRVQVSRHQLVVPGGSFDCIIYSATLHGTALSVSFAPGYGMIRAINYPRKGERLDLISLEVDDANTEYLSSDRDGAEPH